MAKSVIALTLALLIAGAAFGAYKLWDYKENNPNFCMGCHLMKTAFEKWAVSEHRNINCHECHHLTMTEENMLLINLILHNPKAVPPRHGKAIVPWKSCVSCHWDTNPKYPNAPKINTSPGHAKHFFIEKVECSLCHGYRLHMFTAEPRFCIKCHPNNAQVHGMDGMACLACHTDKTRNLRPNRDKCLTCHGSKKQREDIAKTTATVDVRHFKPSRADIAKASAMTTFPEDGAMQFDCYMCHKPHTRLKPVADADCVVCHPRVKKTGKHPAHLGMGFKCLDCHRPHLWKVTRDMGRSKLCTKCHGPVNPADFLKG